MEVNARLDRERSNLEAAAAAARQAQIGVVVDRLGAEMAQTDSSGRQSSTRPTATRMRAWRTRSAKPT